MKKKIIVVIMIMLVAVLVAACGGSPAAPAAEAPAASAPAAEAPAASDEQFKITFVTPLVAHPVWDVARDGFETAASDLNFDGRYVGPQGIDPAEMVNQIEIALAAGADAIVTMPIAPEAMRPVFKTCEEQGVPVVFVASEDDESTSIAFVGTNEAELGRIGAEAIMEKMAGEPILAHILQSTMDASFAIKARDGYLNAFEAYDGVFEMVLNEPCNSDMMIAMERYQNALTAHPEINTLIGVCGEAGPAAAKVARELGRTDLLIVAIDDVEETLDFIRSGDIWGTMAQNFFKIGYEGARIAFNYLTDGSLPAEYKTDSGCMFVTMDNIDTYMESLRK